MTRIFAFPDQLSLADTLCAASGCQKGLWEWRRFPDDESYIRVLSEVRDEPAIILCSLDRPDAKFLPLVFLARALKECGARKITLIAPYLGYMRQDKRFKDGEAVTSDIFAGLLAPFIDEIVTIDPHLHRHAKLEEIYACKCKVLTAASLMAEWIKTRVQNPLVIGPDAESQQWVEIVARAADAPDVVLSKTRQGDQKVDIILPDLKKYEGRTPVLIDDIISSAATMIKAVELLRRQGFKHIACLATHGVFAENSYENLRKLTGVEIITANTIPHASNAIDVAPLFVEYMAL